MASTAKAASPELIEVLGAFLRRNTALSDEDIRGWTRDLAEGRMRPPDSPTDAFLLPHGVSSADATRLPNATTKFEEPASGRNHNPGAHDPRLAALIVRYPTVHEPVVFPKLALEAFDVPSEDVRARIAQFTKYLAARVKAGEQICIDLPDLHRANGIHDHRGNVFLGHNVRRLAFDRRGARAFMRILLTLEAASDNLLNRVCTTKRGLYYRHQAKLPDTDASQLDSDRALAALANMLRVRRKSLGFVEAHRGRVYGRLVIRDDAQVIDLSKGGPGGYGMPRFTDGIEIVSSDAAFILVVEKASVAFRLAQAQFWERVPCIIVCGEGFPSLSAREYVRTLVDTLGIPALICVDADPGGIQVALTYAHGSISTALETPWLACNNIWWAGVLPSDIEKFCQRSDQIRLTDEDRAAARALLEHSSDAHVNQRVRDELSILIDRGAMVEMDAISNDVSRFVNDYLQKKLFDSDLVKL